MKLELKESNSPFWLIGTGKNKTFTGSRTNIPCYYKSRKKQEELAKQIFKNDKNVENVYLITGTQWDNMPSGSKEEFGYIKNKGKLILSKNEIMEANYPKEVSRDPLPKKGVKTYTSVATALEGDNEMKLELKEKTEEKYIFNPGNSKEAWDSEWIKVKELAGKECVIINSEYISNMSKDFEDMQHTIKFNDGTTLDGVFGEYLTPVLEENTVSVDDIPQDLQDKFIATMSDGKPELFKKFTKDELKLFADFVKQLPKQKITNFERNLLLYAISMAHGDDLTIESIKEPVMEAVPVKEIVTAIMYTVDNWDTLKDIIETIKTTSSEIYDKAINIYDYLKNKGADIKAAAKEIGDILTTGNVSESLITVKEKITKLEKGEGDTFENAGTTWKVIKQNDEDTLIVALDKDGNERNKYVVAWGLQKDGSWNQGHYFVNKDTAIKYFDKREKKQESLKESKTEDLQTISKNILDSKSFLDINKNIEKVKNINYDLANDLYKMLRDLQVYRKLDVETCAKKISDKINESSALKESKIISPVGNPQTAGSFVNIDVDLDHMEVSDFIVRLAQAIRSEQTAVLEYVALMSANGITNEDRSVIEDIMKEEKNHMCALTTLLYKQILMNHKDNMDEANDEFTLPKFGVDLFNENNLTESISTILNKIIKESSHNGENDEYVVGNKEDGRTYQGISDAINAIKNIITTSSEEITVQNITLSDKTNLEEEIFNNVQELINELKTDTNYDEIAYHIHEYSKVDKKKAIELMDLLFDLEKNKNPKECIDEIIKHLATTEDTKITSKDNKYNVEIDVEYDSEVANQIFDNIAREVDEYNKNNEINLSELNLKDGKFYFTINKEADEKTIESICNEIFDKATNYEYQITIAK